MIVCKTLEEVKTLPGLGSVFAFDTETNQLRFYGQEMDIITIYDGVYKVLIDLRKVEDEEKKSIFFSLNNLFNRRATLVIGQNIVFDLGVLYNHRITTNSEIFDTMVADHLLDENKQHGLKQMKQEYLGGEKPLSYKEVIDRFGEYSPEFYEYAMNDAVWTYEIAMLQRKRLEDQGLTNLFRYIEMPFLKVLLEMKINGVLIDQNKLAQTTIQLQKEHKDLEIELLSCLGEKVSFQQTLGEGKPTVVSSINFNSSHQIAKILFDKLKLEIVERTPSGAPAVGKVTLMKLKGKHIFVDLLTKYKAIQKLLTAFFEPLPNFIDGDGAVRPEFRDVGTATGRLSCSKPNLQQLPNKTKLVDADTRACFIARPGKKMIAIDYSQQELRVMAQLSQDPKLLKIINDGGDLHLINANNVFDLGIPEEKCFKQHKEYATIKKHYKTERNNGKVFSFGIPYGMGEHKLSRDFNVSIEEAKVLLDKFFDGFPQLKLAIDKVHKEVAKNLMVTSYAGRRRRFTKDDNGRVDFKAFRQSFNFLIQSYGADLIRSACNIIHSHAKARPELGIKFLMTVHDEVVVECNEKDAKEVSELCVLAFEQTTPEGFDVQFKADAEIGNNYGEVK